MTNDGKLVIVILTESAERASNILFSIADAEWHNSNIHINGRDGILHADNVIYKIVRPDEYQGMRADQAILDYYNYDIFKAAKELLSSSCVPEHYQIIDDLDVLNLSRF